MEVAGGEDSREADMMLKITFRNGHFGDVMRDALSVETRKKLYVAKQHRFPENAESLSRMVILRGEIAQLLGYENHAVLKMEENMAKNSTLRRACTRLRGDWSRLLVLSLRGCCCLRGGPLRVGERLKQQMISRSFLSYTSGTGVIILACGERKVSDEKE
jgi:hypothetical protein